MRREHGESAVSITGSDWEHKNNRKLLRVVSRKGAWEMWEEAKRHSDGQLGVCSTLMVF